MLVGCSDNNPANNHKQDLKSEAKEFALKIVQSYIENDSLAYKTYLPDTIYSLEPWEKPVPSDSVSLTAFFSSFDYSQYSMSDYYEVYDPVIMNYEEYAEVDPEWLDAFTYWHPDDQDYLFIGHQVKEGQTEFMVNDLLGFMVTQRTGVWQLRAQ
ncbi:MAG: hypothetical protein GF313_10345 [Caldithrix sp.]|nr:hypothetical protein [Caldithrix sp.]